MSLSELAIPISEDAAHRARISVAVTVSLFALCLVPMCARIYIRALPRWNFWWDDVFIVLGFVRLPPRAHGPPSH